LLACIPPCAGFNINSKISGREPPGLSAGSREAAENLFTGFSSAACAGGPSASVMSPNRFDSKAGRTEGGCCSMPHSCALLCTLVYSAPGLRSLQWMWCQVRSDFWAPACDLSADGLGGWGECLEQSQGNGIGCRGRDLWRLCTSALETVHIEIAPVISQVDFRVCPSFLMVLVSGRPRAKGGGLLVLSGNSIVRPIGGAKDMKETLFEGLSNQRTYAICCGT
jgi:hypothetical protein